MTDRFVLSASLGRWQTNCYLIGDHDRGTGVLVDPGEDGETRAPAMLAEAQVTCDAILLTHGHLDHLWAVPSLARELDVPVLLHADDRWLWDEPAAGFGAPPEALQAEFGLVWDPPTDHLEVVVDHQTLRFAGIDLTVRHNPGHTPGHVTYLGRQLAGARIGLAVGTADTASDDVLFSGDLVFAGAIGRTDFPRGSMDDIFTSLVDTVLPLEDDTLILSGHGPDTTVGRERTRNPFLLEAAARHPGSRGTP